MARIKVGLATAYGYALAGGYTGTEQEFEALLGNIATDLAEIENLSVSVSTLPAGSSATASYSDGVLSLGIPKGDKGDTGDTGATGPTGATPNLTIGTVSTGVAGSDASATITGTAENPVLNLTIPRGNSGDEGLLATAYSSSATYAVGDYCIYNDTLYRCTTAISTAEAWTAAHWTAVTVGDELSDLKADLSNNYAKQDGSYDTLTSGTTKQILATTYVEDSVPYLFRTSGGSADIGDRETDEIVGGSVAWNQSIPNNKKDFSNESTDTLSRLRFCVRQKSSPYTYLLNNTYIDAVGTYEWCVSAPSSFTGIQAIHNGANSNLVFFENGSYPVISGHKYVIRIELDGIDPTTVGGVSSTDFQFIDLTLAFNPTIADYIYTLEQAEAGSGIAKLKSWGFLDKDYYPYDAGTLKHVEGLQAHRMVGFNQWDEEWEVGGLNTSTGAITSTSDRIRSKNFIQALPNTTYCIKAGAGGGQVLYYDADKNYVGYVDSLNWSTGTGATFTTPANCGYIKFNSYANYGTTYNHDICINLSWSGTHNGEYAEYEQHSYTLDSDLVLRGVPKLDANNDMYYDGDTYESDGTVTRRYGIVDLGTLTWNTQANNNYTNFYSSDIASLAKYDASVPTSVCSRYKVVTNNSASATDDLYLWFNANKQIRIKDTAKASMTNAQFKTAMSGVYLVYELATPTTESADPYTNPQIVNDWGTEEYVIDPNITAPIPVGHNTKYMANLRDKLQHLPDLSSDGDGIYLVKQTGTQLELYTYIGPQGLPDIPSADGTYVLKCVVSGGVATADWVAE